MRRSRSSALVLLAACGPGQVFHNQTRDPEKACKDVTLAGPEDVAAVAGCSAVDSITLRTGMALDLSPLGRLVTVRGALAIGPSVGFSELTLPRLASVGKLRVVGNGNLQGVYLPQLARADAVEVEGNNVLTNLSMPKLATVASHVSVTGNPTLESLDLTALASAPAINLSNNPKLTVIEGTLPGLQSGRAESSSNNDPPR